jgi:5-enolpyruvylshikimate-3-phosphate synthase
LPRRFASRRPLPDRGELGLRAQPDKAISQRATMLAALADGTSRISHLAECRDSASNRKLCSMRLATAGAPEKPKPPAISSG